MGHLGQMRLALLHVILTRQMQRQIIIIVLESICPSMQLLNSTLFSNNTHLPPSFKVKTRHIQLVRAGDEQKDPAALFSPIPQEDKANIHSTISTRYLRKCVPTLNEQLLHTISPKTTPPIVLQNASRIQTNQTQVITVMAL
jgi:hypothetical protein